MCKLDSKADLTLSLSCIRGEHSQNKQVHLIFSKWVRLILLHNSSTDFQQPEDVICHRPRKKKQICESPIIGGPLSHMGALLYYVLVPSKRKNTKYKKLTINNKRHEKCEKIYKQLKVTRPLIFDSGFELTQNKSIIINN